MRVLMCGPDASSGGVATHTKNLIIELKKMDVEILPYFDSGSPLNKLKCRTFGLLRCAISMRKKYDIIHVQASGGMFSFISAITGAIASRILRKQLIVTFHYSQTQRFVRNHKYAFGFVFRSSCKMILVSHKQEEAITRIFSEAADKCVVLPNGFNNSLFYPMDKTYCRTQLGLSLDKKIIFNISNLTASKGHRYLISALKRVVSHSHDCELFIAGKGYTKEELEKQIEDTRLQKNVKLLGWIHDDKIPIWMNACDFFVLPSLAEGNPIVMFEALGCGKPFVGTKVGGIPEIIVSDAYGMLVEPANSDDLADKIQLALNREWDCETILRYAERYTWQNIAKEVVSEYEEVLQ